MQRGRLACLLSCLAVVSTLVGEATWVAGGDSVPYLHPRMTALDTLQVIGQFEHAPQNLVVFGDTDHDGVNEIILAASTPDLQGALRFLEYVHYGQFVAVFDRPYTTPLAVGDLDQDGKSDLVDIRGGRLRVHESIDDESHPSILVWESPPVSNQIGFGAIADTDADGRLEIVYLFQLGGMRIVIFECEGDDTYVEKFRSTSPLAPKDDLDPSAQGIYIPWAGDDLVWDLDRDGRPEIANGEDLRLQIFESTGNDMWEEIFTDSTGLINSRIIAGGADTDGDGVRELFVGGEDWSLDPVVRKVFIYQPDGDRSFRRVGELSGDNVSSAGQWGALAQLDFDGKVRFIWGLSRHLRVFVAMNPGEWVLESTIQDPTQYHAAVYAGDLNRNGRDEIYWVSHVRTMPSLVYERPTLPTDVSEGRGHGFGASLRVAPSPCRGDAVVLLDARLAPRAAEWSAFDASGGVVVRRSVDTHPSPWVLPAESLRPGVYFLRVTDARGRSIAMGRTIVVR